jgi:hypothetical protein
VRSLKYEAEPIEHELFAESNIALNYLLSNNEEAFNDYSIFRIRTMKGLWLRGNKVG